MRRRWMLVLLVATAACSGLDRQRVTADRATYDWFAPVFAVYVQRDPLLDEAAKATHLRALDAWRLRIEADEAAVAVPLPSPIPPAVPR